MPQPAPVLHLLLCLSQLSTQDPADSRQPSCSGRFLSLRTSDIWGWVLVCAGGCPVRCRRLSGIPGLHPLMPVAPLNPSCDDQKRLQTLPNVLGGPSRPRLRATALWEWTEGSRPPALKPDRPRSSPLASELHRTGQVTLNEDKLGTCLLGLGDCQMS